MRLERIGPGRFQMTLHAYELATLTAAARWAAEGGQGELAEDAREQLAAVLESYETELRRLNEDRPAGPLPGANGAPTGQAPA